MPARLQSLQFAVGSAKQTDIATISSTFNRFLQLNTDAPFLRYGTETDKDEIGKGNEFISANGVFPTAYDFSHRLDKFGSAEWMLWAWGYAMGTVGLATGLYTIEPLDPCMSLELPYFSVIAKLAEGGGNAFDEAYIGNAIEEVTTSFQYGPGRSSVKTNVSIAGSGRHTIPSGVAMPAVTSEKYALSSSLAISINGIDYVAGSPGAKTILSGSMGWRNNLLLPMGYFPGSGIVDNAAVRGRLLIGNRVPSLSFTAFLQHDSTEYAKLIAQTGGTAVITLTYDSTHFVTWTYNNVSFDMVERTQEDGIVAVTTNVAVRNNGSNVPLVVTGKCGITDIAQ